jgi:pSer/pThr/pTyr-binding forkhead associated (FHA) protein
VAYFLRPPNMIVGRQGGNGHAPDIDLQDLDSLRVVSRQHARLQYEGGRWYVSDMNARNGTWVNDRPVVGAARVELAHGARLRLGNVVLTYDATATANGA